MNATLDTSRLLLSIPEAFASLSIGRSLFYELIASGDIEVVHIGSRALVPVASLEAYVERLRDSLGAS